MRPGESNASTNLEAAVRAHIASLPTCGCGRIAFWQKPSAPDWDTGDREDSPMLSCDKHKPEPCRSGCCPVEELPGAATLRAILNILSL